MRKTLLADWLPTACEGEDCKTVELSRQCESNYVPVAGWAEYGLTQVLTLDVKQPAAPVGGVTVVGNTSTVYSNGSGWCWRGRTMAGTSAAATSARRAQIGARTLRQVAHCAKL